MGRSNNNRNRGEVENLYFELHNSKLQINSQNIRGKLKTNFRTYKVRRHLETNVCTSKEFS